VKGRRQRAEGRGQRAEGRGQRAEGRGQRAPREKIDTKSGINYPLCPHCRDVACNVSTGISRFAQNGSIVTRFGMTGTNCCILRCPKRSTLSNNIKFG